MRLAILAILIVTLHLRWIPNPQSGKQDGWIIEYHPPQGGWQEVDRMEPTARELKVSETAPGRHCYRIRGFRFNGEKSPPSESDCGFN